MTAQTLMLIQSMRDKLHISYSQLTTYLMCPLKYRFQYIEKRQPDRIGSGLIFGKAIHEAAGMYYRSKIDGNEIPFPETKTVFEEALKKGLETDLTVHYRKGETPETMLDLGQQLLTLITGRQTSNRPVAVELPLEGQIHNTKTGEVSDIALFGILDLIEEDEDGNKVIVDLKTSSTRYDDRKVATDLQLTLYSELATQNNLISGDQALLRFDVLLKQKKPSLESYITVRSPSDRQRAMNVLWNVLRAVELGVHYPIQGWQCTECPFEKACDQF